MKGLALKDGGILKALLLTFFNVLIIAGSVMLFLGQSYWLLAVLLVGGLITNVVFILPQGYPYRYLLPGSFFMVLMVLYPIGYTVYVAFTNYGTGHILTMDQVVTQFESRFFLDPDAEEFSFRAFSRDDGAFAFLFTSSTEFLLGMDGKLQAVAFDDPRLVDETGNGITDRIGEYRALERRDLVRLTNELQENVFRYNEEYMLRMRNISSFALSKPRFSFDASKRELTNLLTGEVYVPVDGAFESQSGERLTPGFRSGVRFLNFQRLFTNPQVSGPFFKVFAWTFQWALFSVLTTFVLGLFLAIILNDPFLHFKKFYRSLLILPYAIPAFISALIWRGLLNTEVGVINEMLRSAFNISIPWLQDPTWAKVALVLVNLWLGFPYMMVICLGALQSISGEMYEAATVDGATTWQQFRFITFPLLLVSVAPLLVASFAFNFNNFNVVYLVTRGRPPIPGAQTPAGSTDILISYTYRLAFESGRGVDYGLASAVTILIFLIIGTISFFNFRFTGALEDVSKNV